jgi:hypothetical protein
MASIVFPTLGTRGFLAVIRGYFDESYKDHRVFAIGGYVGRDRDWNPIAKAWRNRRLKNHVQCFHAADCEDGREEFKDLSKEERIQLKTDLIQIVGRSTNLGGFGAAVIIEDFYKVRESSDRAKEVLGPDPYFMCFQMLLTAVCVELEQQGATPGMSVAYIFEEQEEFSGRAKGLYDRFKKINPEYAPRLGTVTYAPKQKFIPLEIADNLAYETMKEVLNNKFDPERPRRISMAKMIPKIRRVDLMGEVELKKLVLFGNTEKDLGFKR